MALNVVWCTPFKPAQFTGISVYIPTVTSTPGITLAAITGAMQHIPMGLPTVWKLLTTSLTPASTVIAAPSVANVLRFLAAPNPPDSELTSEVCVKATID